MPSDDYYASSVSSLHVGGSGARAYAFRHAFALHRLTAWAQEGVDIHAKLPWLSAYLGDQSIIGTSRRRRSCWKGRKDVVVQNQCLTSRAPYKVLSQHIFAHLQDHYTNRDIASSQFTDMFYSRLALAGGLNDRDLDYAASHRTSIIYVKHAA